nr:immunoglobulin heavy chain junction region [Macaca mulatta]
CARGHYEDDFGYYSTLYFFDYW